MSSPPPQDIVISSLFALAYFTAAIPLAVYANDWKESDEAADADSDRIDRIDDSLAATSVSALPRFWYCSELDSSTHNVPRHGYTQG